MFMQSAMRPGAGIQGSAEKHGKCRPVAVLGASSGTAGQFWLLSGGRTGVVMQGLEGQGEQLRDRIHWESRNHPGLFKH